MKKKNILGVLLLIIATFAIVSCSRDEAYESASKKSTIKEDNNSNSRIGFKFDIKIR
ncbi:MULTISPECIES: hypothetical protein [Clostridium]|uniref:Lipoprotein n=1 Tax=Clostridium cibarium TaxID=2762247 RepID=A0ABR8PPP0_9CLOT|nr:MULTISPECIES: hypothetical protein [Clostridium]MBD7910127.1 hypothetical protein [Clostridium cibarium]